MDKALQRFIGSEPFYEVMSDLNALENKLNVATISMKAFLKKLNIKGYYNQFYRVRDRLIALKLIDVKDKGISLTVKGKKLIDALNQVERIVNE